MRPEDPGAGGETAEAAETAGDGSYPLSPMQQGMLFHSVYEAGTGVYVEQLACRLEGPLDVNAFQRAWATTAGDTIREEANPTSERAGTVTVTCRSAVWAAR